MFTAMQRRTTLKIQTYALAILFLVGLSSTLIHCQKTFDTIVPASQTRDISPNCHAHNVNNDPGRIICVCDNSTSDCNDFETFNWPEKEDQALLVETTKAGLRFHVSKLSEKQRLQDDDDELEKIKLNLVKIEIDLSVEHQPILGWGGAFTDAFGYNLRNLSSDLAKKIIESYYGENGLQYNFGRVPLGGSDFSPRAYTYDDSPEPDFELKNWSLAEEDKQLKIPYIKMAKTITNNSGVDLKLFASPWSPPKWMKTSNSLVRGYLLDEDRVYKTYADYLIKFYDAYEKEGINFWGATVQNEPYSANFPMYWFNSLQMNSEQLIKLIGKYLGPALVASGKTRENFKLMIGDDSLGLINKQVPEVLKDQEVQKYIAGLAFHWYMSGTVYSYDSLNQVYDAIKDKIEFVLMSEACSGFQPLATKVDLGSWDRGQGYASDIIEDMLRHTAGWIDWNMALNLNGGPNWAKNFVDSPIIVNSEKQEYYKQPMYYALAHFSRFFKPGSVRVESLMENNTKKLRFFDANDVSTVAVYNKQSGHLIVNILNKSTKQKKVNLSIDGFSTSQDALNDIKRTESFVIDGKSINSVVFKVVA